MMTHLELSSSKDIPHGPYGRFLISKRLQKIAEIDQDIQFIGMDDTIEIWSPRNLEQTLKTDEDFGSEFENIMNAQENP